MDYREALSKHVFFEKKVKPIIKKVYDIQIERINDLKATRTEGRAWLSSKENQLDEEQIAAMTEALCKSDIKLKFARSAATCASYLYKKDYENGVVSFHKFKDVAFEVIEDPEEIKKIVSSNGTLIEGEGAYLMMCKQTKWFVETFEACCKIVAELNGEVKQILKANKRMVKRHNKK